jgi:putative spermidine/putrescine transport system ATP-binding protein
MTIHLKNIHFRYGAIGAAIQDVNIDIEEGELMAVIGPSGCGKSTILKLIAGFIAPSSGQIIIGGQDMSLTPPRERNLGIVFQNYALFPHMSLAENVGYPLKLRQVPQAEAAERIAEALTMVGLNHLADRSPRSLSGGQQQRVALARALVFRPKALLLDEPLSALDAAMRGEMRDEIRRLQRLYGIATLHITHDQEEALSMADKVTVMRDGRVLQTSTPTDLYANPVSHSVAAFVGHANLLDGEVLDAEHVRTLLGDLRCRRHEQVAGSHVSVLIRPEAIGLRNASNGTNIVSGIVTRDRFLGSLRRLDFTTTSGAMLLVETGETGFSPSHIELPPNAVQIIAADQSGAGKSAVGTQSRQH